MLSNLARMDGIPGESHAVNELLVPWWVFSLVVFLVLCGLAIITFTFVNASHRHSKDDAASQSPQDDYL